jgi:hypothetical protein
MKPEEYSEQIVELDSWQVRLTSTRQARFIIVRTIMSRRAHGWLAPVLRAGERPSGRP